MRKNVVKVRALLIQDDRVLMLKQYKGHKLKYTLPGGTVEKLELVKSAIQRECFEEIGIILDTLGIEIVHILHKRKKYEDRMNIYFSVTSWQGEVVCMETDKFCGVEWCDINNLPTTASPTVRHVMQEIKNERLYSQLVIKQSKRIKPKHEEITH